MKWLYNLLIPNCALRVARDGCDLWPEPAEGEDPRGMMRRVLIRQSHGAYSRGHRLVMVDLGADKLCLDCGHRLRKLRWPQHWPSELNRA